jgi:hypothetical protein
MTTTTIYGSTETTCHCGAGFRGSDHCPSCSCEQFEADCGRRPVKGEAMHTPRVLDDNGQTIDVGMWVDAGDPAIVTDIDELEPDFDYEVNRYIGGGVKLHVRYRDGQTDELWCHDTRTGYWDDLLWTCEDVTIIGDGQTEPATLTTFEQRSMFRALMGCSV